MFTRRFTLLALATAAVVYGALVLLLGAAPVTALFTGLAAGALAGVVPSAIRDGRFPGSYAGRGATAVASVVILGSALVVPTALGLDRTTQLSLSLLVLVTGYAAFMLGSAAVIEDDNSAVETPVPNASLPH
jgi:hypothetical protein